MKYLILFLCLAYSQTSLGFNYEIADKFIIEVGESTSNYLAPKDDAEYSFSSFIDHFDPEADPLNFDDFYNRYAFNDEFSKEGGPIFIYIGGHELLNTFWLENGLIYESATELGGILFSIEQRFYGESRPTENLTFADYEFHRVEQYVEDIVTFIEHIKSNFYNHRDSPVVLFGNGFPANVAVWTAQSHPDIIDGVWAVTAPLKGRYNFYEYGDQVGHLLQTHGSQECFDVVLGAFTEIERIFRDQIPSEIESLQSDFNVCEPVSGRLAGEFFAWGLALMVTIITSMGGVEPIGEFCRDITSDPSLSDYEIMSRWAREFSFPGIPLQEECYEWTYDEYISRFTSENWEPMSGVVGRSGMYTRCTQIGWFGATGSLNTPFANTFPVEFYVNHCRDIFNVEFDEDDMIQAIDIDFNARFGGMTPNVSNILFTNGEINNYFSVTVQEDLNESAQAINIPGHLFGEEMFPISENDSLVLRQTKERIQEVIRKWVSA